MDKKDDYDQEDSYANDCYPKSQADSRIQTNFEVIESKVRDLFSNQVDADILLLITRLNRGDAQNAIKHSTSYLKSSAKVSQLKDLKIQIENQIKRQLGDKQKMVRLKNCLKESAAKIFNQLNKIQINQTFLLSCLGQKISSKVLEIINGYAKILGSQCEGGPTYQNLQDQIKQIMSLVLPQIKDQVPEIKKIIQNKSFNHIYDLHKVTRLNQQKFIKCVQCLISFQNHLKFGVNFNESTNKFVLAVMKKIVATTNDWQKWIFIIQNLVEDPLFDFSDNQGFTAEMLKKIYTDVYDLIEYKRYLQLINIPNSLKSRQKRDIQKIIKQINDRLRQKQEKQLRNTLENYDYAELYKNQYVGIAKMRKIYKYIQESCQDYIKYQKQKDSPIDEMKRRLVIDLRKYLLQIGVPFTLHKNIQKLVFENKIYDLLEQALSNNQKKLLFSWIRRNMSEYYKLQFAEGTLRNETQQKLIGIIINLNLNLDYDSIVKSIKIFLDEISLDSLYYSEYFNRHQSQTIKKATENLTTILNYINNNGIDLSQIRFKAQNALLYDILICNQIGSLSGEIVKNFIKQYFKKPQDETVRKSEISLSQQDSLIQLISKVKDLEEYKQQMKKLNTQLSIKKFKQKLNTNLNHDPQLFSNIWSLYEKYGRLNFSNNQLIMKQQDDEVNQVNETLRNEQDGLIQIFRQIQDSEQYYQFRYQYPELIQRKYKQLEKNLLIDFKDILRRKNFANGSIQEFCKSVQDKYYRLSELKTITKFRRMAQITQGLQSYRTYSSLKDENQEQQRFIEEIQKEKQLVQFLQDKRFAKYSPEEKKSIIYLYRQKGDQFTKSVSQIFTKIDAEAVQQRFSENQYQQQKKPRQQISPIKLKPVQGQKLTPARKKQPQKPSPTKLKDGKSSKKLEISQWKQQLKNTIKKTFDELVQNRQLLSVAGDQLKKYEKKNQILNQYQQLLCKARKNAEEQFFKAIQTQEQSSIRSLKCYENVKSNLNDLLVDFSPAQLDLTFLKQKYQILGAKVKKIKEEINSRKKQLTKIEQINQEIKKVDQFKSG